MSNLRTAFIILLALVFISPLSQSARKDKKKRKKKDKPALMINDPIKFNIVPKFTIGTISSDNPFFSSLDFGNKLYLGVGIALEQHFKDHFAFGLSFDFGYKKFSTNDFSITGQTYSIIGMYKFIKEKPSTPYFRLELGQGSGKVKNSDKDYGNHTITKLGVGFLKRTSIKTNTRMELYYKSISPSDEYDVSLSLYGFEFGFGFTL